MVSAILFIGGYSSKESEKKEPVSGNTERTTLKIMIQDEINKKELFNGNISIGRKVGTLADLLKKVEDLGVKMEDSRYGKTIMATKGVKTKDFNRGPWWLYESESNKSCEATGGCNVASSLKIKDGDDFTSTYTTSY